MLSNDDSINGYMEPNNNNTVIGKWFI
jgi:hypothetical protein